MAENCSTTNTMARPTTTPALPANFTGTYGTLYYVRDMKKAVAFYREQVGLTPLMESDGWTEFSLAGHSLCLHAMGDKVVTAGATQLIMQVDDIQKVVGRLKEKRVTFTSEINSTGCGFCAEFKDVDGNAVGLYQKGELKS